MAMDQRKLALAQRFLGTRTETETVDAALDLLAFQAEVADRPAVVQHLHRDGDGEELVADRAHGLPGEQQLILVAKDAGGSVSTREIFAVMFSLLDDTERS